MKASSPTLYEMLKGVVGKLGVIVGLLQVPLRTIVNVPVSVRYCSFKLDFRVPLTVTRYELA